MKAVHIMPALLLQKPSSSSKSKDHVRALERRMEMWHKGQIDLLMNEGETLHLVCRRSKENVILQVFQRDFKGKWRRGM